MNMTKSLWTDQTYGIRIESWNHFAELTKKSDAELKVKTYVYKGPIDYVNQHLLGYPDDGWRHYVLNKHVDECFKNSTVVYTDDEDQTDEDAVLKINSFYYLLKENRIGELKIRDPLCLNWFDNDVGSTIGKPYHGKWGVHPGHTRLLLGGIYKKPVYSIIYDYSNGQLPKKYSNLNFYDPNSAIFNPEWMPVTGRVFIFGNTKQQGNTPGTIHLACGKENGINYREVKSDDANLESLKRPECYMPPRKLELKNNLVTVNDEPVMKYITDDNKYKYNYWELVK